MSGTNPLPQDPVQEPDFSEREALVLARRVARHQLVAAREEVDDVASEGLLRFLRYQRRVGPAAILDWRATLAHITRQAAKDSWRRVKRARMLLESDEPDRVLDVPAAPVHRVFEVFPLVIQFLEQGGHAECADLARRRENDEPWDVVSKALGRSADALKQQWSRCVRRFLKRAVLADSGFAELREWATEEGYLE